MHEAIRTQPRPVDIKERLEKSEFSVPSVVIFRSFQIAKMAPSHCAGHASFEATFEMDSDDEFSTFYTQNVELAVTVYSTRECLPIQTEGEFSQRSHNGVDILTSKTRTLTAPTMKRL